MNDLIENLSALTFACADREAKWFNRYNKDSRDLEWAYKEGIYQARIKELLRLIPEEHLKKIHELLLRKMADLPGATERNRSPGELAQLLRRFQAGDGAVNDDHKFPTNPDPDETPNPS